MNKHELYHYGIKDQKWGVRRYQYKDGHRTRAGKKRYPDRPAYMNNTANKRLNTKTVTDKSKSGKDFTDRINKEKTMKTLNNSEVVSSGSSWLRSVFSTVKKNVAGGENQNGTI